MRWRLTAIQPTPNGTFSPAPSALISASKSHLTNCCDLRCVKITRPGANCRKRGFEPRRTHFDSVHCRLRRFRPSFFEVQGAQGPLSSTRAPACQSVAAWIDRNLLMQLTARNLGGPPPALPSNHFRTCISVHVLGSSKSGSSGRHFLEMRSSKRSRGTR